MHRRWSLGTSRQDSHILSFMTHGSPTKGPLNKVKDGRVTKSSPRAKTLTGYTELSDDEANEDMIKEEPDRGFEDINHDGNSHSS